MNYICIINMVNSNVVKSQGQVEKKQTEKGYKQYNTAYEISLRHNTIPYVCAYSCKNTKIIGTKKLFSNLRITSGKRERGMETHFGFTFICSFTFFPKGCKATVNISSIQWWVYLSI